MGKRDRPLPDVAQVGIGFPSANVPNFLVWHPVNGQLSCAAATKGVWSVAAGVIAQGKHGLFQFGGKYCKGYRGSVWEQEEGTRTANADVQVGGEEPSRAVRGSRVGGQGILDGEVPVMLEGGDGEEVGVAVPR